MPRVAAGLAVCCAALVAQVATCDLVGGRGFGDDYEWYSLEAGLARAAELRQPAMVVIHKSWCGACKRLGPLFAQSQEVQERAGQFVLINVLDDEEPGDAKFKPDGGYIPRILFTDSSGDVLPDIINAEGHPTYKYFYTNGAEIATSMDKALGANRGAQDEL